jgi:predicted transcriptional regulator
LGIAAENGFYDSAPLMSTLSFKLPESLLLRLEQESRARRLTKSAVVRAALERELEPAKSARATSCYDLARDLAGSVRKKLPKDLATNPKHMKSFGR